MCQHEVDMGPIMRCRGITSKAAMMADSIAIVDCWIGAVRPKAPGLKSGWRLEAGVNGGDSLSGSSRVGGGDRCLILCGCGIATWCLVLCVCSTAI